MLTQDNQEALRDTLTRRAVKCVKLAVSHLSEGEFYIAGSCIASDIIRDIDVFPASLDYRIPAENVLSKTSNAVTIKNDPPIQFCSFKKNSLKELLESFDFSHVQAGAHIRDGSIISVGYTDKYVSYRLTQISQFTGTEYPLSSLFRLLKYHKRDEIKKESAGMIISIVGAVVKRGFNGYEDFKKQLDAVDLGLVPEEIDNLTREDLLSFFRVLDKS